jgi:hypothetical protein
MCRLVYCVGEDRFGKQERTKEKRTHQPSKREREITSIRREIRTLSNRYKRSSEEEKEGLKQLREDLRRRLKELRKVERIRKNKRDKNKKRAAFIKNPYGFAANILEGRRSGKLQKPRAEVEAHLKTTHSDTIRQEALGGNSRIEPVEQPEKALDEKEPTLGEVKDVVKKARTRSAPGPNGITYKVYKKCPKLLTRVWRLVKVIWRKGQIPPCWQVAEGCFVPKEENSTEIKQFRTISLLNVEGKIFFAVLARRMTSYMVDNKYINATVQKGGIPGFQVCVEHTSIISQLIKEAKATKGDGPDNCVVGFGQRMWNSATQAH